MKGQGGSKHFGIGAEKTSCKDGFGEGVYERYRSVYSNFAHLNHVTEVMQRNAYVGGLYPCCGYNMYSLQPYIITWRGLAALLILDMGQCEGLNTGMGTKVKNPMPFLFPVIKQFIY